MRPVITVFGATGAQGGGLARAILRDPLRRFAVRAVTRRPQGAAASALRDAGAEVVRGDLDDAASVRRAMDGAHGAFCVTSFWEHGSPDREAAQADTMAQAAKDARVRHVVWSTLEDTREFVAAGLDGMPVLHGRYNVPHYDAKGEANHAFIGRCVPTTLLNTSFYWDNLIHFGMEPRRRAGGTLALVLPMGDAKLPGIAAADVGPCAFGLFVRGDEVVGKTFGICGEQLTGAQMAEQLSLALRETVVHDAMSPEDYAALRFPGADELANMFRFKRDFERTYCARRSVACSRDLHPGLRTFAAWLAEHRERIPVQ